MNLRRKLENGEFAILAEMEPPKGVDVSAMVKNAQRVKGRVDAFVVPEMSSAVMRMSALGGAVILRREGMETVMQVNCRDRNRLALQADLLAASACGVGGILAVNGDDPSFGDHHTAKAVHDIELNELLEAARTLQSGRDMAGIELAGAPKFLVGATVNAGLRGGGLDLELESLDQKIAAGATFFITPPVFDPASIKPFLKRVQPRGIKIIPTVLLLKSAGMARYLAQHRENVHFPERLIERIQGAGDRVRECVRIAAETVQELNREGMSGALIATLGWEHKLPDILEGV
jgi:methylenetetrahydrofolate reductase (NADPH)